MPLCAYSNQLYTHFAGSAVHFDNDQHNQNHNDFGLEYEFKQRSRSIYSARVNHFVNSGGNNSTFLAATGKRCHQTSGTMRACAGIMAGLLNGYRRINNYGFFPVALPYVTVDYRVTGFDLGCVPAFNGYSGFCFVSAKLRLF